MGSRDLASSKLGEYMLKGWILTDEICPTASCAVPLMRSRDRQSIICVIHGAPGNDNRDTSNPEPTISRSSSLSAASVRSQLDRASTPPTPMSNGPASPTFIMPEPTAETMRRRAQSDLASQRIGQKMLKGYAMLGEECLNPDCIGVPLVRPPRADGTKDPHMECVICGNVYVAARGHVGGMQLVSGPGVDVGASGSGAASSGATAAPIQGASGSRKSGHAQPDGASDTRPLSGKGKGKEITAGKTSAASMETGDAVLSRVLASVDRSLAGLAAKLDGLADDGVTESMGETARQMTALLETRHAARREARGAIDPFGK